MHEGQYTKMNKELRVSFEHSFVTLVANLY